MADRELTEIRERIDQHLIDITQADEAMKPIDESFADVSQRAEEQVSEAIKNILYKGNEDVREKMTDTLFDSLYRVIFEKAIHESLDGETLIQAKQLALQYSNQLYQLINKATADKEYIENAASTAEVKLAEGKATINELKNELYKAQKAASYCAKLAESHESTNFFFEDGVLKYRTQNLEGIVFTQEDGVLKANFIQPS